MRILIFMSGGFDTYGPSRHLYDALIEDILADGHIVHLIESHSTGNDPDVPEKFLKNKSFSYETVKLKVTEKKAFAKRYIAGVKYCYRAKKAFRRNKGKYDLVMVQSCPWAPFAITFAKRILKMPVLWNIQDMFPGASIANGAMKKKWMQKFFYRFHKKAYRRADYISVISDDMKLKVIHQGVKPEKIAVIPDWFDDKTVSEIPWDENLFVKKYNMDKKLFYVQYAGTMGFNFDYKMVCNVAERLLNRKDIIFQMTGFGSQMNDFIEETKRRQLTNIHFLPLQEQNMVSHVYSACSVCFIPLPQGVIGNSVPSKAGLLMACKRPIITTSDAGSLYNKMINDNKIGFAFGTDSPQEVADAIIFLSENREKGVEFGKNGFDYGYKLYSRSENTRKYIDLYKKIKDETK